LKKTWGKAVEENWPTKGKHFKAGKGGGGSSLKEEGGEEKRGRSHCKTSVNNRRHYCTVTWGGNKGINVLECCRGCTEDLPGLSQD